MNRWWVALLCLPLIVSCAPLVPYDQMPGGGGDLYSSANSNRMTADAALREAAWQEQALTATAQAPIVPMTQTAAAVTVEAAHAQATSAAGIQTQSAGLTATAVLWTPTPNMTGTLDALAISAAQTQTTLNLKQAEDNNDFRGKLPVYVFVVIVLMLAIVLMWVSRRQRYQFARVDARGNVLPILDIVEGTVTDPDRNPNHQGPITQHVAGQILTQWLRKKLDIKPTLPEVTARRQDETTQRDQYIDLASRGLPSPTRSEDGKKAKVGQMMAQLETSSAPRVEIVSPEQVRPILTDVLPQIAQDAIEAELYSEKKEDGVR